MGWQLEVLEGVAATASEIGSGVYNVLSSTPLSNFLVDNATLEALKQISGTEIAPLVNDIGETIGYVGRAAASSNGSTALSTTWMTITRDAQVVTQEIIDAAIPLVGGGTTADLELGQEITRAGLAAGAGVGGAAGTGVGSTALATVAGPAIAVALGVAAGTALYNIAPEFWTNVETALENAGKTIGGKIISFFKTDGTEYYDEETIDIIKQALIDGGYLSDGVIQSSTSDLTTSIPQPIPSSDNIQTKARPDYPLYSDTTYYDGRFLASQYRSGSNWYGLAAKDASLGNKISRLQNGQIYQNNLNYSYTHNGKTVLYQPQNFSWASTLEGAKVPYSADQFQNGPVAWTIVFGDLTAPAANTLPQDQNDDDPDSPSRYVSPVPTNVTDPIHNPTQNPNQNPTDLYDPTPTVDPGPEDNPSPDIDPNPQPQPDPQPAPNPNPTNPSAPQDPTDPNPPDDNDDDSDPEVPPVVIPMAASALSKVFNPTQAEVDALGQYLWSSTHIEDILKLFQNPIDGIVAFLKIYVTPSTGSHDNIKLGYLDSGVSAAVVTEQIVTVDCGSITIPLDKNNATDYPPYTDIHIYLPFIGIVPLNPYDLVGSQLAVRYRVDCYTGACIAQLKVTRDNMSSVLYEYAGNCGQQLPLTSGNFVQMIANVVSSAVMGGLVSGTKNVAQRAAKGALEGGISALVHGNVEIARSGSLVGNTGMLGCRVPYVIITRAVSADAANYRDFYGYPANKTVYLKNCSGYTRVKDIILHTSATQAERNEIEQLLKSGIII